MGHMESHDLLTHWPIDPLIQSQLWLVYSICSATNAGTHLGETPEGEEVLEVELVDPSVIPPPRGPWVSQGSEKEIELWSVVPTRPPMRHKIWKKRTKFNQPFFFSDRSSRDHKEMYAECEPSKEETFSLSAQLVDRAVQAIPPIEDTHSQTKYVSLLRSPAVCTSFLNTVDSR